MTKGKLGSNANISMWKAPPQRYWCYGVKINLLRRPVKLPCLCVHNKNSIPAVRGSANLNLGQDTTYMTGVRQENYCAYCFSPSTVMQLRAHTCRVKCGWTGHRVVYFDRILAILLPKKKPGVECAAWSEIFREPHKTHSHKYIQRAPETARVIPGKRPLINYTNKWPISPGCLATGLPHHENRIIIMIPECKSSNHSLGQ